MSSDSNGPCLPLWIMAILANTDTHYRLKRAIKNERAFEFFSRECGKNEDLMIELYCTLEGSRLSDFYKALSAFMDAMEYVHATR